MKDLEAGIARVKSFQSDQERMNTLTHALVVAHAGGGRVRAKDGVRGRGHLSRPSAKRHDDGGSRNHQYDHPQQMHPGQ